MMKNVLLKKWTLLLAFLFVGWSAMAQKPAGLSGSGTEGDPYLVSNLLDLQILSTNTMYWASGTYIEQTADIIATETSTWNIGDHDNDAGTVEVEMGFSPIGNLTDIFQGNYDGQNYTISNLYINRPGYDNIGLFGYISGATVKNLNIVDANVIGGDNIGCLVGSSNTSMGTTLVSDCNSSGTVFGNSNVGGLVGAAYESGNQILSSSSSANVEGAAHVGGFIGITSTTIEDCFSTGSVNGFYIQYSGFVIGGFCGQNYGGTIRNCYSTSNVTGEPDVYSIGGFVGECYTGYVYESYSTGNVSGDKTVGGFVGIFTQNSIIRDCFSRGNVTQTAVNYGSKGGFGGYGDGSTIENCYSTGKVFESPGVIWSTYSKGFLGNTDNNDFVANNNFFDSQTSEQTSDAAGAATGKTTLEMKTESTFLDAGWDIGASTSNKWHISSTLNDGYPCFEQEPEQEKNLETTYVGNIGVSLHWDKGTSEERLVFIKEGNSGEPPVVDNTTYTASTTFGEGSEAGSGWYCIYNTGELPEFSEPNYFIVTIANLTAGKEYRVVALGYEGTSGSETYMTSVSAGNAINFTTTNNPEFANPCFENLFEFNGTNGSYPVKLITDGTYLYGVASRGGANNTGVVFKVNKDGTGYIILHEFDNVAGKEPIEIVIDGSVLYGATNYTSDYNGGTIFSINTDGTNFQTLFDTGGGIMDDDWTFVQDVKVYNSKIYFTAIQYEKVNERRLLSMNLDGSDLTTLKIFTYDEGFSENFIIQDDIIYGYLNGWDPTLPYEAKIYSINIDGSAFQYIKQFPADNNTDRVRGLTYYNNLIYGTTSEGGTNDNGTIFNMELDGSNFQLLHSFSTQEGISPRSLVVEDGKLYGNCGSGGVNNYGTLYTIDPDGSNFAKFMDFGASTGKSPMFEEFLSDGSHIYLTTSGGGSNSIGNIIKLCEAATTYTVTFYVSDGTNPIAGAEIDLGFTTLTSAADGYVYVSIPDGTYSWTCNATDFTEQTGSFTVSGATADVDINMGGATTGAMQLVFIVDNMSKDIALPLYGTVNCTVDWGDSSPTEDFNTEGSANHTFPSGGTYSVTISGSLEQFGNGSGYFAGLRNLYEIESFGELGLTSLSGAFYNSNISSVPTDLPSTITDLSYCFMTILNNATITNLDLWDVSNVTNMEGMFKQTSSFNQDISNWNVSNVTNMKEMFAYATSFNQNLSNWNVSNVVNMEGMFNNVDAFNQPFTNWDVSNVTNMRAMFANTDVFNQNINDWNVSNVTDMSYMFNQAIAFNQPLNNWDVSSVTDMSYMFSETEVFNQNINDWNVSNVTNMFAMFSTTNSFDQPINDWDVSNVTNMTYMFNEASAFNQPLDNWDISSVGSLDVMFYNATSFNQDISSWNTSNVSSMYFMFNNATSFDQNLSSWDISSVSSMNDMFTNVTLSTENYDAILIGWAAQTVHDNVEFGGGNSQYSCVASDAVNTLTNTHNWTIIDAGMIADNINPTITCVANQEVTADNTHTYTVQATEFDPTETTDNCEVESVVNDFNSMATLAGATLPEGTTTIVWTVTDVAGNQTTCEYDVLVNDFVGINDLSDLGINIYPNPTTGIVNVNFDKVSNFVKVEVTDVTGKTILTIQQFNNSTIDLSNNPNGIYFIKINTNEGVFVEKIIKQ